MSAVIVLAAAAGYIAVGVVVAAVVSRWFTTSDTGFLGLVTLIWPVAVLVELTMAGVGALGRAALWLARRRRGAA